MNLATRARLAGFLARCLVAGRPLLDLPEEDDDQRREAWRRRKRWLDQVGDGLRHAGMDYAWRVRLDFPLSHPPRPAGGAPWEPGPQPPGREVHAERIAIARRLLAELLDGGEVPAQPWPPRAWEG